MEAATGKRMFELRSAVHTRRTSHIHQHTRHGEEDVLASLSGKEQAKIEEWVKARVDTRMPLQYILNTYAMHAHSCASLYSPFTALYSVDFCGVTLKTRAPVLIPRPGTCAFPSRALTLTRTVVTRN